MTRKYGDRMPGDPRRPTTELSDPQMIDVGWTGVNELLMACHPCQRRIGNVDENPLPLCVHWRNSIMRQEDPMIWDYWELKTQMAEDTLVLNRNVQVLVPLTREPLEYVRLTLMPVVTEPRLKDPQYEVVWLYGTDEITGDVNSLTLGYITMRESRLALRELFLNAIDLLDYDTLPCTAVWHSEITWETTFGSDADEAHKISDVLSRAFFGRCHTCEEESEGIVPYVATRGRSGVPYPAKRKAKR